MVFFNTCWTAVICVVVYLHIEICASLRNRGTFLLSCHLLLKNGLFCSQCRCFGDLFNPFLSASSHLYALYRDAIVFNPFRNTGLIDHKNKCVLQNCVRAYIQIQDIKEFKCKSYYSEWDWRAPNFISCICTFLILVLRAQVHNFLRFSTVMSFRYFLLSWVGGASFAGK